MVIRAVSFSPYFGRMAGTETQHLLQPGCSFRCLRMALSLDHVQSSREPCIACHRHASAPGNDDQHGHVIPEFIGGTIVSHVFFVFLFISFVSKELVLPICKDHLTFHVDIDLRELYRPIMYSDPAANLDVSLKIFILRVHLVLRNWRAWQVDATRIVSHPGSAEFLTRTVPSMAAAAVAQLGQDAAQLQLAVNPDKLLYYERGGHFKSHRDTEKERGMFGTLIVQLPTQCGHEGGALLVNHGGTTKLFDSSVRSSTRFHHMAFFADCEHKLEKITSGVRLCLVFNLVRRGPLNLVAAGSPGFWAAVSRVEAALLPWVQGLEAAGRSPRSWPSLWSTSTQRRVLLSPG